MTLTAAQTLLDAAKPVEALKVLATALRDTPQDADLYAQASRALLVAVTDLKSLHDWNETSRHAFYRQLLRHTPCPDPMLTLAHEAASNLTSGNPDGVRQLVAELAPVLAAELDTVEGGNASFKNIVVFVLTIRSVAGPWLSQEQLSRLHLEWFERFTPQDLALPYSVMFNADIFDQNRDDLLAAYWPKDDTKKLTHLPPDTVLFFSWLAGREAFDGPQRLSAYLDHHLPRSEVDRAAAKTLLLHYTDGTPYSHLETWGLSDLAPLLEQTGSRKIKPSEGNPSRFGAGLLQNRSYQAVNAAVQRFAPVLVGRGKPKVAICLSGQLRGYETALATWRKTILRNVEPVFFLHTWTGIGRSDAQPFRYVLPFAGTAFPDAYRQVALSMGYDAMRARYPALYTALAAGNMATPEHLKAIYGTDHVVLEDDADAQFASFTNQQKMHYKIHAADQMAQSCGGFDLHMRLRPDLAIKLVGFDWRDLASACAARPMVFAEKPFGLHYRNLMIGDQCAIGTPDVMRLYSGTWDSFSPLAQAGLGRCPKHLTGHVSLAMTAYTNGLVVERLPLRFGTLQDAEPLGSRDILIALQHDGRGDANDQKLLNAVRTDLRS
ncbi:MAG: hypothetical protein ACI80I_002704 [Akkermansiaceae bacterium]|jgi:hypothetical protein